MRFWAYMLAPALCQSVDLRGFEPLSIQDSEHCWTSFNFKSHFAAGRAGGFVGVYRTGAPNLPFWAPSRHARPRPCLGLAGDPLQSCFTARLGVQVDNSVLIDGEVVSSTDYRWGYMPQGGGGLGSYWMELRLWVQPGPHTLLVLFMPASRYFERHFRTVPRERVHERLIKPAPDGGTLSPRVSDAKYRTIPVLRHYSLSRLQIVTHASLQFVTCCDRKGQIIMHGAGPSGSLPLLALSDNMQEQYAMGLASAPTQYDESHCSAVIPSAVIWVNAYRQDGIHHVVSDKLPLLWFAAASMCAVSPESELEGARLDHDCIAKTHLVQRTWPTGHLADPHAFPSYMRELLHAVSDHAPSTFDFDDLVTAANDCAPGEGCQHVCFRRLSIYYDQFMFHGVDGEHGERVPSFRPDSAVDRRFVLWRDYRAHLLFRLGVNASTAPSAHMVFLRRPHSRSTLNHDEIVAALVGAGFYVESVTPDYHSVKTLAALVSSARVLCAVNSGVGNAVFLPPNSGLLELQPKPANFQSNEPLTHDVMFIFLRIHHIKYTCIRNFVLPMELRAIATFAKASRLDIDSTAERHEDVPELVEEYKELVRHNKLFGDQPRAPVRFDPDRIVQLAAELNEVMVDHARACDGRSPEQLNEPDLALWCSVGMLRQQLCFGEEAYTFSPEADYSLGL
jgi:hypothetical protein